MEEERKAVTAGEKEEHMRQYKDFGAEVRLMFEIITSNMLSPKEIEDILAFKFGMKYCPAAQQSLNIYSPFLVDQARYNIEFVIYIEDTLHYVIMNGIHNYNFDPMVAIKRKIIHELCVHYRCTSLSYGIEPNRFVRVFLDRGRVPQPRLSEIVS